MRLTEPGSEGRVIPFRRAQDGPGTPLPTDVRLLDRVRVGAATRHYSPRTEKAYVGWIRRFILFHGKRHPDEMGSSRSAPSSPPRDRGQGQRLDPEPGAGRPAVPLPGGAGARASNGWAISSTPSVPAHVPVVLAPDGGARLLAQLDGPTRLVRLLALRRRPAPARGPAAARQGRRLRPARDHRARRQRPEGPPDRAARRCCSTPCARTSTPSGASTRRTSAEGRGSVALPDALASQVPHRAPRVGLAMGLPRDPPLRRPPTPARRRRHHLHETVIQRAVRARRHRRRHPQARHAPHPAPLLRDPPPREPATTSAPSRSSSATRTSAPR